MRVDMYHHSDSERERRIEAKLDEILRAVKRQGVIMATGLEELELAVTEQTTVTSSGIALMNGLKDKLDELIAAGNNDPKLLALRDAIAANTQATVAAIVRNTVAESELPGG